MFFCVAILARAATLEKRERSERLHASGHAREVRARGAARALAVATLALLVCMIVPTYAKAAVSGEVFAGPATVPTDTSKAVAGVAAPDRFVATAILLGYTPDQISGWSDDVKAKLSNESTGGSFWTLSQSLIAWEGASSDSLAVVSALGALGESIWNVAEALYGNDLWVAYYDKALAASAASDLSSVLAGESIGGGSGGGSGNTSVPDSLTFTMGDFVGASNYAFWGYASDDYYAPLGVTLTVAMQYVVNEFSSRAEELPYHYYLLWRNGNLYPGRPMTLNVYFTDNPMSVTDAGISVNAGTRVATKQYDSSNVSVNGANNITLTYNSRQVTDVTYSNNNQFMNFNRPAFLIDNQSSGGTPVVPPTQWPDEPSAPSPPELPEPGTDVPVTPTPWTTIISPSFDFDLNITTEPTSNDLIDWVKKIYYELKAFHTDGQDWFEEIGDGLSSVVQAINHADNQIYSELLVIDETLRSEGLKIRNYMYQMFHWLKDQLNFQNDSFNDSNIVYWLKRIWSKLGNGDINLRPTDPTTEPENWWDWLVRAIQNFLIGLAATSTDLISEIADLASQVMHEFPFSIPWDIAAVLAALTASPITPVITVTVPAINGWWSSFDFVIDLHPFDGAAETIRLMEKLLFTGLLIWKSRELLDFMDVTKWFN